MNLFLLIILSKSIPCPSRLEHIHGGAQVYNYDATTSCGVSRGINKQTVPHHIHIPYYFMISEILELQNSFPIFFWYIYPKIDENTISKSQQGILGFFVWSLESDLSGSHCWDSIQRNDDQNFTQSNSTWVIPRFCVNFLSFGTPLLGTSFWQISPQFLPQFS